MVSNKSDQTQTGHCAPELNISKLTIEVFYRVHIEQLILRFILLNVTVLIGHLLPLTSDGYELTVAVVNQLNKRVLTCLSRCSVVEETF